MLVTFPDVALLAWLIRGDVPQNLAERRDHKHRVDIFTIFFEILKKPL